MPDANTLAAVLSAGDPHEYLSGLEMDDYIAVAHDAIDTIADLTLTIAKDPAPTTVRMIRPAWVETVANLASDARTWLDDPAAIGEPDYEYALDPALCQARAIDKLDDLLGVIAEVWGYPEFPEVDQSCYRAAEARIAVLYAELETYRQYDEERNRT